MTTAITTNDPAIALAALELEFDNLSADADAQNLRAARREEQAALEQQIEKLHEAASDVRQGALVQAGFSLAGAAASFTATSAVGAGIGADAIRAAGNAASALAVPMGRWTGEVPQRNDEAAAKLAEAHVSDARARAEEAEHHRQRMEQATDRTLSAVNEIVSAEAQGNLALIANI